MSQGDKSSIVYSGSLMFSLQRPAKHLCEGPSRGW